MKPQKKRSDFSIGDLVWVPQNTEVQKTYAWMDGCAYYPGDHTDHPLHAIVVGRFSDSLNSQYVNLAVIWKEKHIICRLEDIFPIKEGK
jgi:hypothetical protein